MHVSHVFFFILFTVLFSEEKFQELMYRTSLTVAAGQEIYPFGLLSPFILARFP